MQEKEATRRVTGEVEGQKSNMGAFRPLTPSMSHLPLEGLVPALPGVLNSEITLLVLGTIILISYCLG